MPDQPVVQSVPADTSFGSLRQIEAGDLSVGCAESGPGDGPVVILLHGWPYDVHSFVDVAPLLAAAGYRVIIPFVRGYGPTRFLSSTTPRNGQQAVLAFDVIALLDALKIQQAVIGGFDWGGRTADIVAALPTPLADPEWTPSRSTSTLRTPAAAPRSEVVDQRAS